MTAKEKAIELVERFYVCKISTNRFRNEEAKQSALICVDEILESLWNVGHSDVNDQIEYWREVKQYLLL